VEKYTSMEILFFFFSSRAVSSRGTEREQYRKINSEVDVEVGRVRREPKVHFLFA
jgi:hypothetical protein